MSVWQVSGRGGHSVWTQGWQRNDRRPHVHKSRWGAAAAVALAVAAVPRLPGRSRLPRRCLQLPMPCVFSPHPPEGASSSEADSTPARAAAPRFFLDGSVVARTTWVVRDARLTGAAPTPKAPGREVERAAIMMMRTGVWPLRCESNVGVGEGSREQNNGVHERTRSGVTVCQLCSFLQRNWHLRLACVLASRQRKQVVLARLRNTLYLHENNRGARLRCKLLLATRWWWRRLRPRWGSGARRRRGPPLQSVTSNEPVTLTGRPESACRSRASVTAVASSASHCAASHYYTDLMRQGSCSRRRTMPPDGSSARFKS